MSPRAMPPAALPRELPIALRPNAIKVLPPSAAYLRSRDEVMDSVEEEATVENLRNRRRQSRRSREGYLAGALCRGWRTQSVAGGRRIKAWDTAEGPLDLYDGGCGGLTRLPTR